MASNFASVLEVGLTIGFMKPGSGTYGSSGNRLWALIWPWFCISSWRVILGQVSLYSLIAGLKQYFCLGRVTFSEEP